MAKKDTKTYRFNLVDFFIVVALIFAICTLVFVVLGNDILDITEDKYEISYILSVNTEDTSSFPIGKEIYTKKGKNAGRISAVDEVENGYTILTITTQAYEVDKDLFIKGQKLTRGEVFSLQLADKSIIDALCVSIVKEN